MNSDWVNAPALTWAPLVVLTSVFLLALLAFLVRSAVYGRPRTERVVKQGGSILLGEYMMEYGLWVFGPIARVATRLEIHPDAFSWASLALQLAAGLALALGGFALGGWLLVFGSACDALDGAVARARGVASDAGEVLDAAVDRWGEMAVFFGLAWFYRDLWWGFALALSACAGAVMVSYARAKGEIYGIDAKMGLMQRHERAAWLSVATIASALAHFVRPETPRPVYPLVLFALAVIAVLGNWTALRRVNHVRRELRRK